MSLLVIAVVVLGGAFLALKLFAGVVRFVLGGFGILIAIGLIIYWASNDDDGAVTTTTPTDISTPAQ